MTHIYYEKRKGRRFCIKHIHGICLEKLGIRNVGGGYAIIDKCATPKVGDVVICIRNGANLSPYCKQIKKIDGDSYIVGTAYLDESKDFEFEASEIVGVVLETYGKTWGYREYIRPTHLRKKTKKGGAE